MSNIVGFDLKPKPDTSLHNMLEYGLNKHLQRLEEIGAAAVKKYCLEKALEKMKFEWQDMCFELIPYRETRFHPNISGKDTERMLEIEGFDGIKNLTYLNP